MTPALTVSNRYGSRIQSAQPVENSGEKLGATGGQPRKYGGEDADNVEPRCGRPQAPHTPHRYFPHPLWTQITGPTWEDDTSPHAPPALLRLRPLLYLPTSKPTVG